jgi:hypothetical protein
MAVVRKEFTPPPTLEEAEERILSLTIECREIETQLGDPLKEDEYNNEDDFLRWRQSAKWALTMRQGELWSLKLWVKRHHRNREAS